MELIAAILNIVVVNNIVHKSDKPYVAISGESVHLS